MKMKIKKITHNHILSWIYALVVAIPLVTILVRCCYITFNKNAFESYSGNQQIVTDIQTNYRYETNEVNSTDDLIAGNIYKITNVTSTDNLVFVANDIYFMERNGATNYLYMVSYLSKDGSYFVFDNPNLKFLNRNGEFISQTSQSNNFPLTFYFVLKNRNSLTISDISKISASDYNIIDSYTPTYQETTNLDNAFEYSINELTQNGNTGELNLVNWFGDLFLDMSNAKTQLYLGFINYYMNYVLMVSCVYLLFSVLMWFLTWARRLLSKGLGE